MSEAPLTKTHAQPPAHIEKGGEGKENIRQEDIIVPMAILAQSMSGPVQDDLWKAGEIRCSLTGELLAEKGKEISFVPIFHFREWIIWGSIDSNEGIIERSLDPKGELATRWAQGNEPDKNGRVVTEYHQFVVIFPEVNHNCYILSFGRTKWKKGKQLLGLVSFRGDYPLFAGQYAVKSSQEASQAGHKYHNYNLRNDGWAAEDIYKRAKELYEGIHKAYQANTLKANMDAEQSVGDGETTSDF